MRARVLAPAAAVAAMTAFGCTDVTDIERLEVLDAGVVAGTAFLDQNGNGSIDAGDRPLVGALVILGTPGAQDTLRSTQADSLGIFIIREVPLGTHRVVLSPSILGDSLTTLASAAGVTVEFGDTLALTLGAAYPTLTLAEVRAAAPGRRVFTHGIALNTRVSSGDGVVHLQEGSVYLRTTNVPPVAVQASDSVRMLGRTAIDNGQPTLDQVTAFVLRQNAVFLNPPLVSIADADSAGGAADDAALVRVGPAEIGDTTTVGGHLRFWAHNGADSLEVELRNFLSISPNPAIRPDTVVRVLRATGLLVPYIDASGPRWRLLPRSPADVVTENKLADIEVTVGFDQSTVSAGDTVEIRVTARNGPSTQATHTATEVTLTNRVHPALTFLSATTTRGFYQAATGIWTVGDLAPGTPADTLRIRVEVVGPGPVADTVRFGGLQREIEGNATNNSAIATLTIS